MATHITDLPDHVLATILDRLPAADAARFACASRASRDVAHDEHSWRARARRLTGGVDVGDPAAWAPRAATHRELVGGLLSVAGPLLAPPAWASTTSPLGTLAVVELRPPDGVVVVGLTPTCLFGPLLRTPLAAIDLDARAGPAARCLRRGRPPAGRGAVPDTHPASVAVERAGGDEGGVGSPLAPPSAVHITCSAGCRQDLTDAQARVNGIMVPVESSAPPRPGAAGLPDLAPGPLRMEATLRSLGGLSLHPDAPAPPLTLTPLPWSAVPPHLASAPGAGLVGVWRGTYGAHGVEIVRIAFEGEETLTAPHHDRALVATKVTGDANVPAGAVTFTVFPGAHGARGAAAARAAGAVTTLPHGGGPLRLPPGTHTDVDVMSADPPIVVDAVWPATATVAGVGFENPSTVPATLATLVGRPDAFLMAWGGLGMLSLFVRLHEEELKRRD